MTKENLIGLTMSGLEQKLVSLGEKPFHGRQLFKWLYNTGQYDFDLMTDMATGLRAKLAEKYCFTPLALESNIYLFILIVIQINLFANQYLHILPSAL